MRSRIDAVTLWLYACCAMIFIMALLGAITRLTESGLSITSWDPIMGALPPLDETAWNKAFAGYQTIPQYQIFNRGMSLDEFKHIFFWEYLHRLWGRLIGLVFAIPLITFLITKKIDRRLFAKLLAIFALGGLQGFIGWFMVQSGLETRTTVSPYRLALHLGFALLLYALLLWTALNRKTAQVPLPLAGLMRKHQALPLAARARGGLSPQSRPHQLHGWLTLLLLTLTITYGALTAGLRAGKAYNTWPLMDGTLLPDAAWTLQPQWLNLFANTALVQFTHRWLGPTTFVMILTWIARRWNTATTENKKHLIALALMATLQIALGLSTLLSQVEIIIAVTHQAGAILLLTLMLINLHDLHAETTSRK